MLICVVNIGQARTFWNSTHCLLSPFTLDWSLNLWHNPMWNMAVNNISYPIDPLSTRTEKGYITLMIPFFFCSVYESPKGTGQGVRRSKRPLTACHTRRKFPMETTQNSVKGRVRYQVWSVGGCHCIWSGHRMSFSICERETSYCLIRSPYRP